MTKLAILEYPDPRLRKKAEPVAVVDDALRRLADDMLETMYAAKGVGLAATQVDVHKRLLVLDVSEERNQPLGAHQSGDSGSRGPRADRRGLLVPAGDLRQAAARDPHPAWVRWAATVSRSKWMRTGLLAVCIQHEMDHLEGKLFVDYLSELKRQLIRRRLEKERKQRSKGSETRAAAPGTSVPALGAYLSVPRGRDSRGMLTGS